jgi:hypothetical protein
METSQDKDRHKTKKRVRDSPLLPARSDHKRKNLLQYPSDKIQIKSKSAEPEVVSKPPTPTVSDANEDEDLSSKELVKAKTILQHVEVLSVAAGLGSTHGFPGWVGLMGRVGSKS